jgi:hypothetical protein
MHVDTHLQLRIQARMSACACMRAYYANACTWLPVLLNVHVCACVCMSHGGRGAGALTGLGGGQGERKSQLLSVRPPTKLYFCQSQTRSLKKNIYLLNDTGTTLEGKRRN